VGTATNTQQLGATKGRLQVSVDIPPPLTMGTTEVGICVISGKRHDFLFHAEFIHIVSNG